MAFVVIDYSTYSPVLLDFVQFATGCLVITGNCIKVTFSGDTAVDAVVSHTCSKELQLSTAIYISKIEIYFTQQ